MTKDASFKQRVRARMAKTGESYAAARAQLDRFQPPAEADPAPVLTRRESAEGTEISIRLEDNVLNVTNGDAVVEVLQTPGVQVLPWRDVLHDGPVPALPDDRLREVRARFLSGPNHPHDEVLRDLDERDRTLEAFKDRSYVLWFEADLYDQLQIIQILDRLRGLEVSPGRIHLVSAGEFPGVARFGGLGQLDHGGLMRLLRDAVPLEQGDLDTATKAWQAFTADDPSGLHEITRVSSPALRFLGEAFGRLMQEYPWEADGLSLTQRRILLAIEGGAQTAAEAFQEASRRERRPFLGDWSAYAIMRELATTGVRPLLEIEGDADPSDPAFRTQPVTLTERGRLIANGAVPFEGVDRWIGGIQLRPLTPGTTSWRYDDRLERLIGV
ncbi:hypothetical protein [Flindersiella endophytica]